MEHPLGPTVALKDLVLEQLTVALIDRYDPQKALGHGAMASVYLAYDIKHERKVAIKALRHHIDVLVVKRTGSGPTWLASAAELGRL